ncbi:zinc-dependent alcohol dehydrogenase [Phytoactinopolyspora mesophila]|uniref:Zinc-binding dehydrogenase n=1 Tax=Phytoactinopolyspora mesophila TaxID=2650750 RepID=A0A7K3M152_9ACTN|nr:zinc-binding alcohol dehydrogenase [Phytoactinopolyspora mesophila]NDL56622.1 zinc-binding dehydrogenase [Phytoactinopolyspora mesophila]
MVMTERRVVFPSAGMVELQSFELPDVTDNDVRVSTKYSLISNGTEHTALYGNFEQGTHWADYVRYPFNPGYSIVGTVTAIGAEVKGISEGDHVVARVGHASGHVLPSTQCTPIPGDVSLGDACWFALAKISLMGAFAAEYVLGDTVVIVGAGPIGQMSVRWASAAGAKEVVVVDPAIARLKMATLGGASGTVATQLDAGFGDVIEACEGKRPRVVVDTTGNASVLPSALRLVADQGRLVLLGDTGRPSEQNLTVDLIIRGISLVGAHDGLSKYQQEFSEAGDRGLHELFFELVRTGRFSVDGLVTHRFRPTECVEAYEAARARDDAIGIRFEW